MSNPTHTIRFTQKQFDFLKGLISKEMDFVRDGLYDDDDESILAIRCIAHSIGAKSDLYPEDEDPMADPMGDYTGRNV